MMQISDEMVRVALKAYNKALRKLVDVSKEPKPISVNDIRRAGIDAALSAALAAMWRPIDEAPKDGTPILGYWAPITGVYAQNEGQAFGIVIWERGTWCSPDDTDNDYRDPSMWMPLPSPPKMEG
jgi:hypothetical protein